MLGLALGLYLGSGRAGGGTPVPPVEKPTILTAPTITLDGYTATITLGTFDGADSTTHELLVDGVSVGPISAGTHDVSEYAGSTLVVRSTGTNAAGSTVSDSDPVAVPIVYAQGMGATDATGMVVSFPLREAGTSKRVWVDSVNGSDSYNGYSPYPGYPLNGTGSQLQWGATGKSATANSAYGPKATYDAGENACGSYSVGANPGEGNQLFLAIGGTYTRTSTSGTFAYRKGYSASYPFCIQSYDPIDPLNEALHGRAQGADRPVMTYTETAQFTLSRGDGYNYDNFVFRGLYFVGPTAGSERAITLLNFNSNILVENCVLDGIEIDFNQAKGDTTTYPGYAHNNNNIIMRLCASYGQWNSGGSHSQGIHSDNTNLIIEDCVFYHNGWKIGASRDDAVSIGGPDIFKQALYLSAGAGTVAMARRNVIIDASAAAISNRGNCLDYHNVIIDCPLVATLAGAVSALWKEEPAGNYCGFKYNLVMGGADITSGSPRGYGPQAENSLPGSYCSGNLLVNNPKYGAVNNAVFYLQTENNLPTDMLFENNAAYSYSPTKFVTKKVSGSTDPTYTDNDNSNSASSPATNADIYAAAGWADKDAMIADIIASPRAGLAYKLMRAAGGLFSFDFSLGEDSDVPPMMDSPPYITGVAKVGNVLTATAPTSPNGSVGAPQWLRCTSSGVTAISGATGSTYTLISADVGANMSVSYPLSGASGNGIGTASVTAVVTA